MNNVDMSQLQYWGNKVKIVGKELDEIYLQHLIRDDFENFLQSFDLITYGYKQRNKLESLVPEYGNLVSRVLTLSDAMIEYARSVTELEENATGLFETEELENYPKFGDNVQEGNSIENYEDYECYQYIDDPYIFSTEYNDGKKFVYSDIYRKCTWAWGLTEISDYKNYFKTIFFKERFTDDYADGILEETIEAILDNAPGSTTTEWVSTDSIYDKINDFLGIDNFEDIFKELIKRLKDANEIGQTLKDFKKDPAYKKMIGLLNNPNAIKAVDLWLASALNGVSVFAEQAEDVVDILDDTEFYLNLFYRFFFDYTTQIDYIDTIKVSLLEAGYPAFQLNECLEKVRAEYDDAMTNFLNNMIEFAGEKVEDWAQGKITSLVTETFPVLKTVDFTLKVVSDTAELVAGDVAEAAQTFAGTQMCTNVLVDTYEYYMSLVKAGRATQEDLERANTLFNVIREAKIKEYTAMQTMVGEKSPNYSYYTQKIQELTNMGK